MIRRHGRWLALIGVLLAAFPMVARGASATVDIEGFKFQPAAVTIAVGDSVTWVNADSAPHDAVANDGTWLTPTLTTGADGAIVFETVGTFAYRCSIHPEMTGTVTVVSALPATDMASGAATDVERGSSRAGLLALVALVALVVAGRWVGRRGPRESVS